MQSALPYLIAALGLWAAAMLWQVRKLTVRYAEVRHRNVEQDRPVKG
jgi:hypothetical protein